jgi:ornithine--oxo-acid transaminase
MTATSLPTALDRQYAEHVNPQWVRLLDLLQMNVLYERCLGSELYTADGRRVLDFLSGYCVYNTGHNHPAIVAELHRELDRNGPMMLQSHVSELAAELAQRLTRLAGGRLRRCVFTNSGSEGVEAAIKFARAHTGRSGLLYAGGSFHGLTCGALSVTGDAAWRKGFGPMLPGTQEVHFGDLDSLQQQLSARKIAAFIVEPVQGEGGIRIPDPTYLSAAQDLCRAHGTLLILDEVQTGLFRTGPFLAAHRYRVDPDIVILAKALSGGLVPVGAVLMTEAVSNSVYSSLGRAFVHASTFAENSLAMRAGLATLDVLERERLGERAESLGAELRYKLTEALSPYEMVKSVHGAGLLCGIEFQAPEQLRLRLAYESFRRIHPAMFGQILVMRMFRDKNILTQICGNNFAVLKAAPPLVVTSEQIDDFVAAVHDVVDMAHTTAAFWAEALGLARRAVNI